jgi:hypothetical protein
VYELKRSSHTSRGSSKAWQHRYAPGRKEMEKEIGKRKLQENSKRKEQRKKSQPGGSLHFGHKNPQE